MDDYEKAIYDMEMREIESAYLNNQMSYEEYLMALKVKRADWYARLATKGMGPGPEWSEAFSREWEKSMKRNA